MPVILASSVGPEVPILDEEGKMICRISSSLDLVRGDLVEVYYGSNLVDVKILGRNIKHGDGGHYLSSYRGRIA